MLVAYQILLSPRPHVESLQESKTLDRIYRVLFHIIPAHIIDVITQILGHKPFLVRLIGKMHYGLDLYEYFTTRTVSAKCKG